MGDKGRMNKLKPCPFCGSEKVKCAGINFEDENTIHAHIQCPECRQYVSSAWYYENSKELNDLVKNHPDIVWDNAIELWNRRHNNGC